MKKKVIGAGVLAASLIAIHSIHGETLFASNQVNHTGEPSSGQPVRSETSTSIDTITKNEPATSASRMDTNVTDETVPTSTSESVNPGSTSTESSSTDDTSSTSESSTQESSESSSSSQDSSSSESSTSESSSSSSSQSSSSSTSSSESKESSSSSEKNTTSESSSEKTKPSSEGSSESTTGTTEQPSAKDNGTHPSIQIPNQTSVPEANASSSLFGNTIEGGVLDSDAVILDDSLRVSEMSESNLKGFELPLLSTFSSKERAIVVYEGIKQVGKSEVKVTSDGQNEQENNYSLTNASQLMNYLSIQLFGKNFDQLAQIEGSFETKEAGDLLYKDNSLMGIYIGSNRYLAVDKDKETKKDSEKKIVQIKVLDSKNRNLNVRKITFPALTEYGKKQEKNYPANMDYKANPQTQSFIQKIADNAQSLGNKYDVFASVMIAQAILESGSGTSGLSQAPYHNLFGVKGTYKGNSVNFSTEEDRGNGQNYTIQASFRSYPSYGDSLGDYVTLIRGGIQGNNKYYEGSWRSKAKNYLKAADNLTGKYATDTSYNRKISSLIAAYHLTKYDAKQASKMPLSTGTTSAILVGKDKIPTEYKERMNYPDYDGKNYNVSGSYPVGQCTWYAYNRMAQLGKTVDDFMGNGGQWGSKARALGYNVSSEPKAGYLVSFTPGSAGSDPSYGHVAFVEAVGSEGILISECNVVGGTAISYRVINNDLARSSLVTYLSPK